MMPVYFDCNACGTREHTICDFAEHAGEHDRSMSELLEVKLVRQEDARRRACFTFDEITRMVRTTMLLADAERLRHRLRLVGYRSFDEFDDELRRQQLVEHVAEHAAGDAE